MQNVETPSQPEPAEGSPHAEAGALGKEPARPIIDPPDVGQVDEQTEAADTESYTFTYPPDEIEPLMQQVADWYDGLSYETKLAAAMVNELVTHEGHLPDKHFGDRVSARLHKAALVDEAPPELAVFKGFYAALCTTPA